MCQTLIYTHSSECDVRTLVLSPDANSVADAVMDPFAEPKPCHCGKTTKPRRIPAWFACEFHDCCMLTARRVHDRMCPCDEQLVYHRYERWTQHQHPKATARRGGWQPHPVLDAHIIRGEFVPSAEHPEFRYVRAKIAQLGRLIYELFVAVSAAWEDYAHQKISLRVLQPHEFDSSATARISLRWQQAVRAWAQSEDVFVAFRKAVSLLERMDFEGMGSAQGLWRLVV